MRVISSVIASLLALGAQAAPRLTIQVAEDTRVSPARIETLTGDFQALSQRVYHYLGTTPETPVNVVLSKHAGPGFYVDDKILIAPDDEEMLETWIHELTHHVTGHESSFFFKEGIATHVVEAVFAQEHRVPKGWPQYGQTNDAWVNLFVQRGQMQTLADAKARDGYQGSPPEQDFRSWQVYCIGGSFVGWLIRTQGLAAFHKAFDSDTVAPEWEARWLADLRRQNLPAFNPMQHLPDRARYRRYATRLSSPDGK